MVLSALAKTLPNAMLNWHIKLEMYVLRPFVLPQS